MKSYRVETVSHKDTSSACPFSRRTAKRSLPAVGDSPFLPAERERPQLPGVGQYRANVIGRLRKGVAMKKLRTLADVLRQAGFVRITGLFLIFYLLCSTAVWLSEPTTLTFGDGLWFSFETVSTIGFGDIPAETPVARAITVVLSVISIFYIAMLTGVAVNYCNTLIKMRQKDTMARFMDDLEHLEELDRDELADLSRRVREYRRRQR